MKLLHTWARFQEPESALNCPGQYHLPCNFFINDRQLLGGIGPLECWQWMYSLMPWSFPQGNHVSLISLCRPLPQSKIVGPVNARNTWDESGCKHNRRPAWFEGRATGSDRHPGWPVLQWLADPKEQSSSSPGHQPIDPAVVCHQNPADATRRRVSKRPKAASKGWSRKSQKKAADFYLGSVDPPGISNLLPPIIGG